MFRQPALILQVICYFGQLVEVIWHICVLGTKEESTYLGPTLSRPETRDNNEMDGLEFRCTASPSGRSGSLGDDEKRLVA